VGIRRVVSVARRAARENGSAAADPVFRDRMAQLWIEEEALRLSAMRMRIPALTADRPHALQLMNKLVFSEYYQRLTDLACEMLGPDGALWLGEPSAPDRAEWPRAYMNSFGMTIGGGTSEILRNILGERVLGLPKTR
jgi:alkylation response protein AidB-like acyl-CoA dehydrogenase